MNFKQMGHIFLTSEESFLLYFAKLETAGDLMVKLSLNFILDCQTVKDCLAIFRLFTLKLFAKQSEILMFPSLCSTLCVFWVSWVVCV